MSPSEYEHHAADYFRKLGYRTEVTPATSDYGVDVFATRGTERVAIQAKLFGHTTRSVNRRMVMELHGAKDYFDCTEAVLVTDGRILPDAMEVANKLRVRILTLDGVHDPQPRPVGPSASQRAFEEIWVEHVMPLEGAEIVRGSGGSNRIVQVDWGGVTRITSNGRVGKIAIETFRFAVEKLLERGHVSRDEINQYDAARVSSGVVLILAQVPFFETTRPAGLRYRKPSPEPAVHT